MGAGAKDGYRGCRCQVTLSEAVSAVGRVSESIRKSTGILRCEVQNLCAAGACDDDLGSELVARADWATSDGHVVTKHGPDLSGLLGLVLHRDRSRFVVMRYRKQRRVRALGQALLLAARAENVGDAFLHEGRHAGVFVGCELL